MDFLLDDIEYMLNEELDFINEIFYDKPYTNDEFISNFPKNIFFEDKLYIFRFFLEKGYNFYSINWIVYNQLYLCDIINHPNFNDFLSLIYDKFKENILLFNQEDIFKFITDSRFNFRNYILNCNKFYEEIKIDDEKMDISILNNELENYRLEDVD